MSPDKGKGKSKGSRRAKAPVRVVRPRDPGPPYVVVWHPSAVSERDGSWPAEERVAMAHAVQKLEVVGPALGAPHSSAVQGTVGQGFRELRPRRGRSRWRPIYRQVDAATFVIFAVGQEAEIDQASFDAAVRRAVKRFDQLEI